jgi:GNAT superfamily N-acetyltransferase
MNRGEFRIRHARREDAGRLAELVLALMEHLGDSPEGFDATRFTEDGFGPEPQFTVLVADGGNDLVGYALIHDAYEPAFAARGVYLSDLYVCPEMRRRGVGRALLSEVAKDAASRRRTFVWWVARQEDSRPFYRTVANVEQPVTAYAVTFEAFDRLSA